MNLSKLGDWSGQVPLEWVGEPNDFKKANADAVRRTLNFGSPDGTKSSASGGICVVINIASGHVPDFCKEGYKNVYELTVGDEVPGPSKTRLFVDAALQDAIGVDFKQTYFAATELTGTGIRFYGDVCLVLKLGEEARNTPILDRNSYDLVRSPFKEEIQNDSVRCAAKAKELAGHFDPDLAHMAVIKVMSRTSIQERRLTAGEIAEHLRADEDYIEVLWQQMVDTGAVTEARLSASDAAVEALAAAHLVGGPSPSIATLTYQAQRRAAEASLRQAKIATRVVVTSGRVKG